MARIEGVSREKAGPLTRIVYRISERMSGGKLPEPVTVNAHHPLLMHGYGAFELAFQRSHKAPEKLKALAECKAAALAGCEWCLDFGSVVAREAGVTEQQLRALPGFRDSDAFDEDEKLVLEYAEGISRTPVDVPDELFERLRRRFDEPQIVELTYAAAIENLRARFNWALGIASQSYSEGAFCLVPERPAEQPDPPGATTPMAATPGQPRG
jgi:AhpD family alkylhydroperoxidase